MALKKDKISKYIEALYSEGSELNHIQDLQQRKIQAAKQAGLDPEEESVKAVMALTDKNTNTIIFNHLTQTQSNDYIILMAKQQLLWELQRDVMLPPIVTDDPKQRQEDRKLRLQLNKELTEIHEEVDQLYRKIFKHEDVAKVSQGIIRMMTPEQRIKRQA